MNLHEYQAKEILQKYQIPIPDFEIAENLSEVKTILQKGKFNEAVLKVQVHAGGRGKAGGVKIAKNSDEILSAAKQLIGMKIVNEQTGPHGLISKKILITPILEIHNEYYLSFLVDRKMAQPMVVASLEGGMNIEDVARKMPEKIFKMALPINGDLKNFHIRNLINFFKWSGDIAKQGESLIKNLFKAFYEQDASLLEINPLILSHNTLWALDVKLTIDDNALFRHSEIEKSFDLSQISYNEAMAKKEDLAYIALEGNIGCMVNGAGLAMATMDLIQYYGGMPANFLDVGGSASKEKIAYGFKLILKDTQVKAIFINIFGGIMNCALLAEGIVQASKEDQIKVPLIVRLEGTNVEQGRTILKESGMNIISAMTMEEGAQKAIKAIRGNDADTR